MTRPLRRRGGGAYAPATMAAFGAWYRSSALAQEKTGEFPLLGPATDIYAVTALAAVLVQEDLIARMLAEHADADGVGRAGEGPANTIIRDSQWRKRDNRGALRMSDADAAQLGITTGDTVRLSTRRTATSRSP